MAKARQDAQQQCLPPKATSARYSTSRSSKQGYLRHGLSEAGPDERPPARRQCPVSPASTIHSRAFRHFHEVARTGSDRTESWCETIGSFPIVLSWKRKHSTLGGPVISAASESLFDCIGTGRRVPCAGILLVLSTYFASEKFSPLNSTKPIVGFHRNPRFCCAKRHPGWTVRRQFRQSGGPSQGSRSREENGGSAASPPLRSVSALRLLRGKRVIVSGSLAGKVSSNSLVNCRSISLLSRSLSDSLVIMYSFHTCCRTSRNVTSCHA